MKRCPTRAKNFRKLSTSKILALQEEAQEMLGASIEQSTVRTYASVWSQFLEFSAYALGERPSEEAAIMYLTHRMNEDSGRSMSKQGIYQYGKVLRAISARLEEPWDNEMLNAFIKTLEHEGAALPRSQATVMEKGEFWRRWNEVSMTEEQKWTLFVMWKTASRADDIQKLRLEDIRKWRQYVLVHWDPRNSQSRLREGQRSHRVKNDSHGLGWSVLISDPRNHQFLEYVRLSKLAGKERLTDMSTGEVTRLLKNMRRDLTAHSIKKSALNVLIDCGIPAEEIPKLSKHKDVARDVPRSLRTYLRPERLAYAMGTHTLTEHL